MWIWFVVAAIALILELLTGTFFLLLVAVAAAGAGVVTWLGGELAWQLLAFSVLGIAGFFILKSSGLMKRGSRHGASRNTDLNLDIGQMVQVTDWSPINTAEVHYRGAKWQVRLDPAVNGKPAPGGYRIVDIDGIVFIVTPVSERPLTSSSS
ncbi:NfeD family protein [Advenella mimigardefordensis]|uniref:Putative NfeD-like protein n=1 Tax=Advenella mimigardefordensis (strain DSM 17166 / LMG 22922 / DPN7) TaxID=1247726 RepID=W0PG29_ADVMD|nr:NfeD family protein [Advenella mimigardefordensis]AHG64033.1 putative NfeD-like protein [Advenella mimigardefordensis DPN7]